MRKFFSKVCIALQWRFNAWVYKPYVEPYIIALRQWCYIRKLKKKDVVNVVFFPMNVAMWKYQGIYDLLKQDKRFRLYIFLAPATTFSYESQCKDMQEMRDYFTNRNMSFVDYELEKGEEAANVRTIVDPDILFYAQPYEDCISHCLRFSCFKDKLLCHVPYAFHARKAEFYNFNMRFNNIAWKLYYQSEENKKQAEQWAYNHGRNMIIVGNSNADEYAKPLEHDPWKIKERNIKRIIWSPHFTIVDKIGFSQMSNFLNMADDMKQLAIDYSDKVTIAFKPHPRLYTELLKHPDWGEERTREYYDFWRNSSSTQLETGDFVDLFKGSDAMIHDSGSFTVDYLYFNKPVLYDNPDIEAAKDTANEMGKKAYDVHYKVSSNEDIKRFIDDVVLAGHDPMKAQREAYYQKYLLPPNGKTVAQNIYDDLVKSLKIK